MKEIIKFKYASTLFFHIFSPRMVYCVGSSAHRIIFDCFSCVHITILFYYNTTSYIVVLSKEYLPYDFRKKMNSSVVQTFVAFSYEIKRFSDFKILLSTVLLCYVVMCGAALRSICVFFLSHEENYFWCGSPDFELIKIYRVEKGSKGKCSPGHPQSYVFW